jgi:hypothetical protein
VKPLSCARVRFYGNLIIALLIYTVTEPLYLQRDQELIRLSLTSSFLRFPLLFLLWSNLCRSRSPLRLPSFKQRFNAKLSYFNSKAISSLSTAMNSSSYELAPPLPPLRNRNPPFHIPKNSMARFTSSIPGSL